MRLDERIVLFLKGKTNIEVSPEPAVFFEQFANVVLRKVDDSIKQHIAREVLLRFSSQEEFKREAATVRVAGLNSLLWRTEFMEQEDFTRMGDFCLFMSGIFPGFVEYSKRQPGLIYYLTHGRDCYAAAMDRGGFHVSKDVLMALSDNFRDYAGALNVASDVVFKGIK